MWVWLVELGRLDAIPPARVAGRTCPVMRRCRLVNPPLAGCWVSVHRRRVSGHHPANHFTRVSTAAAPGGSAAIVSWR